MFGGYWSDRQLAAGVEGDLSLRRPIGRRHPAPDELGQTLAGHGAEGDWRLAAQRTIARVQSRMLCGLFVDPEPYRIGRPIQLFGR